MKKEVGSSAIERAATKYKAGHAREAARILMEHAKRIAGQGTAGKVIENNEHLALSDRIAEVGMRLFRAGDCPLRQKHDLEARKWARERADLDRKCERIEQIVDVYLAHFKDLISIVHEPNASESIRRFKRENLLEHIAHGHETDLSTDEQKQYLLTNQVLEDIAGLFKYAYSFNNGFGKMIYHRSIRLGAKHRYLAILMELQSSSKTLEELKSLQAEVRDAPAYLMQTPLPYPMLGAEHELLVDLHKLDERAQDSCAIS